MNRCQVLFQSQFLAVKRFHHPSDVPHVDPKDVRSEEFSVNFGEQGSFAVSRCCCSGGSRSCVRSYRGCGWRAGS
jgi:hypothetical protein